MASDKRQRLARLANLQSRLKSLHKTRQAVHLKDAAAADREAAELTQSFDTPDSLSALFPELYHERIGRALARKEKSLLEASREAEKTAMADARAGIAERAHKKIVRRHERESEEKAALEILEQRLKPNGE